MALQDILNKILADAESKAANIKAEAETRAQAITADAKVEAEKQAEIIKTAGKQKAEVMQRKAASAVTRQDKHKTLQVKQQLINETYELAAEQLKKLSNAEKEHIFARMLAAINTTSGVILPASNDAALLKTVVQKSGKDFKLGNETEAIGGFIFIGDTLEMDFRFEEILRTEVKPKLEREITKILFGANK